MDDSSLKSLKLFPRGQKEPLALNPPFSRTTKSYSAIIQSDIDAVTVNAAPNEPDAFCQPQRAAQDGSIPIKDGDNQIQVKVDAPDGSSSIYTVVVYRPSAADASLRDIQLSSGKLIPSFSRSETLFVALVDPNMHTFTVTATPTNAKSSISPSQTINSALTRGDTPLAFTVTSADKSNTSTISIIARKEKTGSRTKLISNESINKESICSICSSILFRPRKSIPAQSSACIHTFCLTCMNIFKLVTTTTTESEQIQTFTCPLCAYADDLIPPLPDMTSYKRGAFTNNPIVDADTDAESRIASSISVSCPFTSFGCVEGSKMKIADITSHVASSCQHIPKPCTECGTLTASALSLADSKHKETCTYTCSCGSKIRERDRQLHSKLCSLRSDPPTQQQPSPPSAWESRLIDRKASWASSIDACTSSASKSWSSYASSISTALASVTESLGTTHTAIDSTTLTEISRMYATAIAINTETVKTRGGSLDALLHMQLGLALEEQWMRQNMFDPTTRRTQPNTSSGTNDNQEAAESFMSDEVDGLLLQLGVPPSASDATKIKAMETEYHRLLSQGLSDQAAEVQGLHTWKIKQVAGSGGGIGSGSESDTDELRAKIAGSTVFLHRACEKYMDAVKINSTNAEALTHLGRVCILLCRYTDAVSHLKTALAWQPMSQTSITLLAIANCASYTESITQGTPPSVTKDDAVEALQYMVDHMQTLNTSLWSSVRKDLADVDKSVMWGSMSVSGAPLTSAFPQHPFLLCTNMYCTSHPIVSQMHLVYARTSPILAAPTRSVTSIDAIMDLLHMLPDTISRTPKHTATFTHLCHALCDAQAHILINTIITHQQHPNFVATVSHLIASTLRSLTRRMTHGPDSILESNISGTDTTMPSFTASDTHAIATQPPLVTDTIQLWERITQTVVAYTTLSTQGTGTDPLALTCLGEAQLEAFDRGVSSTPDLTTKLVDAETTFRACIVLLSLYTSTEPLDVSTALTGVRAQRWWVDLDRWVSVANTVSKPDPKPTATATNRSNAANKPGSKPSVSTAAKPAPAAASASKKPVAKPTPQATPAKTTPAATKTPTSTAKPATQPNTTPKQEQASNASTSPTKPKEARSESAATKPANPPPAKKTGSTTPSKPTADAKSHAKTPATPATTKVPAQPASKQPDALQDQPQQQQQQQKLPLSESEIQSAVYKSNLGLARILVRRLTQSPTSKDTDQSSTITTIVSHFRAAMQSSPLSHDPYIELGSFLEHHHSQSQSQSPKRGANIESITAAADVYASYPFPSIDTVTPTQDDLYLHSEISRTHMKIGRYTDPCLVRSLIAEGRTGGIKTISKYIDTLDQAGQNQTLVQVYCGVNRKPKDDPELVAFFKAKFWI